MPRRSPNALTTPSGRPAAWGTRVRERIDTSMIVKKLTGHINGEGEMSQTQIQAARILLDRTVPVLKAIEVRHEDGGNAKTISDRQLLDIIDGQARLVKVEQDQ
jgi:hypothetical protein